MRSRRVGRRPSGWARRAGVCSPGTRRGPSSRSPLYEGALLAPRNALVDPVRLSEGLRAAAVARRASRIHERTRVRKITFRRDRVEVSGGGRNRPRGEARSGDERLYAITCVRRWRARFLPLYDYVLVSDPLTPAQRKAIGWRSRRAVIDTRTFFNYYRLTDDGRILWGTSEAAYYPGNRVDPALRPLAAPLRGARGELPAALSAARRPRVSLPLGRADRLDDAADPLLRVGRTAAACTTGSATRATGSAPRRIAGRILAHRALELPSALLELAMVRKKPIPYPPEPLRRAAVALVTGALRRVDAGRRPGVLLKALDRLGISFSS